jgi:hypothetical protein
MFCVRLELDLYISYISMRPQRVSLVCVFPNGPVLRSLDNIQLRIHIT